MVITSMGGIKGCLQQRRFFSWSHPKPPSTSGVVRKLGRPSPSSSKFNICCSVTLAIKSSWFKSPLRFFLPPSSFPLLLHPSQTPTNKLVIIISICLGLGFMQSL